MSISWGNWDVRVYAANALIGLAYRFAGGYPIVLDKLRALLSDPVPAVRLQVAQRLDVFSVAAPELMWELGKGIARHEPDFEVVAGYLAYALRGFAASEPVRCEQIIQIVDARLEADAPTDARIVNFVQEVLGDWTATLHVFHGRRLPRLWLEDWAVAPQRNREKLRAFLAPLREALFVRYRPAPAAGELACCDRAHAALEMILATAMVTADRAYAYLQVVGFGDPEHPAVNQYRSAEQTMGYALNQLYFKSGAYRSPDGKGTPGLPNDATKAQFLVDYRRVLELAAASRQPSTLHHLLELYEYLIPGDPGVVFAAIHSIVLGRGKEQGYQFEGLGVAVVVRIVHRFVADHRALFEDEARRAQLVEILQLFSDVGWPEALRMLYQLPELLR